MSCKLYVHGAWWVRHEDVQDCVIRAGQTFSKLAALFPMWSRWYRPHNSLAHVGRPETVLSNNADAIHKYFLPIQSDPDLGVRLSASSEPENGAGIERCHFTTRCGSRTAYSGYNTLSIELPVSDIVPELYNQELLCRTVAALRGIWNPDWLIVWDLRTRLTPEPWRPGPVLGWINYLADSIATVDDRLPEGWHWFEEDEKKVFFYGGGPPIINDSRHAHAFEEMFALIHWAKREMTC